MKTEFTPGPWTLSEKWYDGNGHYIYNIKGNTGHKVINNSQTLETTEPNIISISQREMYQHHGAFEDKENGTGWYNCSEIPYEANANLIGSAPDLFEALQKVYKIAVECDLLETLNSEENNYIENAIKKALNIA